MNAGRTGFTTGTCAAAAAKAATMILCGLEPPLQVEIGLPDGARVALPVEQAEGDTNAASATVRKDAGDDPDVTDGCLVVASVEWRMGDRMTLAAGDGVGTVTLPGLSAAPGEPAINPVPRQMIQDAIREITDRGLQVTISVPGGRELAEKTFNPRLGIKGGLSILGTSGIVRPFSATALRDALKCALNVAVACNVKSPVFVPGRIGEKAARRHLRLVPEQLIEVSNEWGFVLDEAAKYDFSRLLVSGASRKIGQACHGPMGHALIEIHKRGSVGVGSRPRNSRQNLRGSKDCRRNIRVVAGNGPQELGRQTERANSSSRQQSIAETVPRRDSAGGHERRNTRHGRRYLQMAIVRHITIVGCGPGSPEYVTPAAIAAVEKADLLIGTERLVRLFSPRPTQSVVVNSTVEQALDAIEQRPDCKNVAVLVTGDPGIFSLARLVIERFGREQCRVIPGISSVQAAFARLGLDWADTRILSAHKEDPDPDDSLVKIRKNCGPSGASRLFAMGCRPHSGECPGGSQDLCL